MTISAYPLAWPAGWKRTDPAHRADGRFGKRVREAGKSWAALKDLTVADAVSRVLEELQRMGITREDVVISTNLKTRLDGLPRSDQKRPEDPGVAVYWQEFSGARRCMAIDLYARVEDNLAAVAATLDAMRAIERHGGAAVLERAFTGFQALPAPGAGDSWWQVLEVPQTATFEQAQAAFRRLRAIHHPDRPGGSHDAMARINKAWADAQEVIR